MVHNPVSYSEGLEFERQHEDGSFMVLCSSSRQALDQIVLKIGLNRLGVKVFLSIVWYYKKHDISETGAVSVPGERVRSIYPTGSVYQR
jgi:hypothetical protein